MVGKEGPRKGGRKEGLLCIKEHLVARVYTRKEGYRANWRYISHSFDTSYFLIECRKVG